MCYNVSIALGCHIGKTSPFLVLPRGYLLFWLIDPKHFNVDPIHQEERRRCWAGLMMLHMIQSTALGNPAPSWQVSNTVQLPADVDDIDITLDGIRHRGDLAGPTQMTYLLYKFRLYGVSNSIYNEIFSNNQPSRETIQKLDQDICHLQEAWERQYLSNQRHDETIPVCHIVHLNILYGYSHQLFLLLHRPFFAQSIIGLGVPNESQLRCISSAEALLDIYRLCCETPSFHPYMWYTNGLGTFHAFHAAVVLAVALVQPIYQAQYHRFRQIIKDTLTQFDASAKRSAVARKAGRILRLLL
jgi:hypothetical protein